MGSIIGLCFILLGASQLCRGISLDDCPHNLIRDKYLLAYGNKCYRFDLKRNFYWADAEDECKQLGGHLVEIDEVDEMNFIMSSLRTMRFDGDQLWIGLSDKAKEGSFRWTTGHPAYFTFWAYNQPASGLTGLTHDMEDCVYMSFKDEGHWFDHFCNLLFDWYPFICEFESIRSTPASATTKAHTTGKTTVTTVTTS